jgi:hypothetical protein
MASLRILGKVTRRGQIGFHLCSDHLTFGGVEGLGFLAGGGTADGGAELGFHHHPDVIGTDGLIYLGGLLRLQGGEMRKILSLLSAPLINLRNKLFALQARLVIIFFPIGSFR